MSNGHVEQTVVNQMQKDCQLGLALSEIIERARTSLGDRGEYTLLVLRHFMVAFGLSLKDARLLEACPIIGGTAMTVTEVDSFLRPKMDNFLQELDLGP
ncbi:hypothetical protein [Planctopirus hydrillae]|uniref:Uncharacterized protein n=1 Tax=Planctopirus hydrillae TaxID=1841610 RepID=A0A1C3E5C2_9PLAN|nr:hypothetical protein [Planctopirus hydrillae]ODA28446.1 hypothetical protein A6X21_12035 [Planctopirus hydrillae]